MCGREVDSIIDVFVAIYSVILYRELTDADNTTRVGVSWMRVRARWIIGHLGDPSPNARRAMHALVLGYERR